MKKNIWLLLLAGALLCSCIYLGGRAMAVAFDRGSEMKEVNRLPWTLHPCDIGNDFTSINYDRQHGVFLANGALDHKDGNEDGQPITETGELMENAEEYPLLEALYLKASLRDEAGQIRYGCIRYDGSIAIPFEYDDLEGFDGEYCIVRKAAQWLVIDKNNEIVYAAPGGRTLKRLSDDTFSEESHETREIIRITEGKAVPVKPGHDVEENPDYGGEPADSQKGIIVFIRDDKYGLKNSGGKVLAEPVFDSLQLVGDRYLIAVYRGRYGIAKTDQLPGKS